METTQPKKSKRSLEENDKDDEIKKVKIEEKKEDILEPIKIDSLGSIVKWSPSFLSEEKANELMEHLKKECNFIHGEFSMYGKKVKTPRLQSWMADENLVVKGLFQKQKQKPWSPLVQEVRERLEKLLNCKFDYLLLNYYRDGNDYIGYHADREARKEGKNVIASISLGTTRKFLMKQVKGGSKELEYKLTHGSLIVMEGNTQTYWKHTIPKEKNVTKERINLTFRID